MTTDTGINVLQLPKVPVPTASSTKLPESTPISAASIPATAPAPLVKDSGTKPNTVKAQVIAVPSTPPPVKTVPPVVSPAPLANASTPAPAVAMNRGELRAQTTQLTPSGVRSYVGTLTKLAPPTKTLLAKMYGDL